MAEPENAGTPPTEPVVSESAGTTGQAVDGSESAGKPVDPALAMAWKSKAERVNEVERELADTRARLAAAERTQYAQADPMGQMLQQLQERAQYGDTDAATQLATFRMVATQQAENMLTKELVKRGVPAALWDRVEGIMRGSNYRTSVDDAITQARGAEVPDLAKQLEAERKRVADLEKALNGRTVTNGSNGQNPATTTPAAMSGSDIPEMTYDEYNRLLKSLPESEAKALRDKGVRFKR